MTPAAQSDSHTDQPPAYTTLHGSSYTQIPLRYDRKQSLAEFNALADKQALLAAGIAKSTSNEKVTKALEESSTAAAQAVANIESMFGQLIINLTSIDDGSEEIERFLKEIQEIRQMYRNVVDESRILAVTTSVYAKIECLEVIIITFTADERFPVEKRIERTQKFIAQGEDIRRSQTTLNGRFHTFQGTFTVFVDSFSQWAVEQEGDTDEQIQNLAKKLLELVQKIIEIDVILQIVSLTMSVTIPVVGVLVASSNSAAPIILCEGAGLSDIVIAKVVDIAWAKNSLLHEQRLTLRKIRQLELSKTQAIWAQLELEGQGDLKTFSDSLVTIQNVRINAQKEANSIELWLKRGANPSDRPLYMKLVLEDGVRVYSAMAEFLRVYADGGVHIDK